MWISVKPSLFFIVVVKMTCGFLHTQAIVLLVHVRLDGTRQEKVVEKKNKKEKKF